MSENTVQRKQQNIKQIIWQSFCMSLQANWSKTEETVILMYINAVLWNIEGRDSPFCLISAYNCLAWQKWACTVCTHWQVRVQTFPKWIKPHACATFSQWAYCEHICFSSSKWGILVGSKWGSLWCFRELVLRTVTHHSIHHVIFEIHLWE